MTLKPPKSNLPLMWTRHYNGCREMDPIARLVNLRLAPFTSFEAFRHWLVCLNFVDKEAWFAGIGWPEGGPYCRNAVYLENTGYPMLLDMFHGRK